jgi:hypothetical protein
MSDQTTGQADNSPLPTSLVKGMEKVREAYEADISGAAVQQTLDRISAQTVLRADAFNDVSNHAHRKAHRSFRPPLWFAFGLATGVAAAIALTLLPLPSLFPRSMTAVREKESNDSGPVRTVAVADPMRAARNCIAELLESGIPFSYRVSGDGAALRFTVSAQLSSGMKKWLTDHGVEPPEAGEEMNLVFVRSG